MILERIQEEKKVVVSELSREYEVSEETIRRDLDRLEEEGHIVKSYGGAVLNESNVTELPHNVRRGVNTAAKQKIAELVNREIEKRMIISFWMLPRLRYLLQRAIKQKEASYRDHKFHRESAGAVHGDRLGRDLHRRAA